MKARAWRINGKPMYEAQRVVNIRVQCTKDSLEFLSEINAFLEKEKINTAHHTHGTWGAGFMAQYFYEDDAEKFIAWLGKRAKKGISDPKKDPPEKDK